MLNTDIYLYDREISKNADYTVWMAFPGVKSFALSSLGFLWMFRSIDLMDDVNVEIVCSDTKKTKFMRDNVDLIGFSFTFDTDYLTIFSMLEKNNIPLKTNERNDASPLIFAGGPVVTANPTPYNEIFDFFVIGDGENINAEIIKLCKENRDKPRSEVLKLLSEIEGIYVPKFKSKVNKITNKLSECVYTPIISENAFFKNTFILEMSRGCANRCGFCLASYCNLPLRTVQYDDIIDTIELGLKYTNKIALLGAQISAHPQFNEVFECLYKKMQNGDKIEMSVSSLRVDAIKPEIVKTLVSGGQKNVTLAIEAGSERLRKVINKNLSEEQIFNAVKIAVDNGLKGLKFYGMIGLPTETYEDLDAMIDLAKRIKQQYKGFDITFGFSSFVPKPNTPFQWIGREDTKSLEKKAQYLKKEMHKIGVTANISSIKWDYWQAVLSRGDSSFTDFLIDVYKSGGALGAYKKSAQKFNINADYYALENYNFDQNLPWDFINMKPAKEFLITENKKLLSQ
ncbi:radical SAM protein [bacterium]|nr:radical SAM protein [bacterium]